MPTCEWYNIPKSGLMELADADTFSNSGFSNVSLKLLYFMPPSSENVWEARFE